MRQTNSTCNSPQFYPTTHSRTCSIREVANVVGISLGSAIDIRNRIKENILFQNRHSTRSPQGQRKITSVNSTQAAYKHSTTANSSFRKRKECGCMSRRSDGICEMKESGHAYKIGGLISNQTMCGIGLHSPGHTLTGRWTNGSGSCSLMRALSGAWGPLAGSTITATGSTTFCNLTRPAQRHKVEEEKC